MISENTNLQSSILFYWNFTKIVVSSSNSREQTGSRSEVSCDFFLKILNILKVFEVFIRIVISLHIFEYLFTYFCLYFRVLGNLINHHLYKVRSCISTSNKECAKFIKNLRFINYCLIVPSIIHPCIFI